MPPRATALEGLAPDQRAAVELVLRQGRSYGELADLLGLSEDTIRARARGGLEALAPDMPPPPRSGEVADWLLGQQAERHASRTRELLLADAATRRWAELVAAPLRELYGDDVPALPGEGRRGAAPRARPLRAEPPVAEAPAAPPREPGDAPPADTDEPPGRSSRLGGALLLGGLVVVVAAVLAFVLLRGGDDNQGSNTPTAAASPAATPTATASTGLTANDILLRGPAGSKAVGLMRLFQANDNTVRFALAAQSVPENKKGETYSIWFTKKDGSSLQLGAVKDPVTAKGNLTSAGPSNNDVDKFPSWFATYDNVVVTRDAKGASKPGDVILSGNLPHSQG